MANEILMRMTMRSGAQAVIEADPARLETRSYAGQTAANRLLEVGRIIAVKDGGDWYNRQPGRAAWVERFIDPKKIAAFEAAPYIE